MLDVDKLADVRERVKMHLKAHRSLAGLDIERNAPPEGMRFAFVAETPEPPPSRRQDRESWYRCSYCETDRRFISGRLVYCADGRLRMIGEICWVHHIDDAEWHAADDEWRLFKRRDRFEETRAKLVPAARMMRVALRDRAEHRKLLEFADTFDKRFASAFPHLAAALRRAARNNGGALVVERMVPDFGAFEGARGQRTAQEQSDRPPRYRPQAELIHRLSGAEALFPMSGGGCIHLLDRAFAEICSAIDRNQKIDWETATNRVFKREADAFEQECVDAMRAIDLVVKRMKAVETFLGTRNMSGVVKWANDTDCELLLAQGGAFAVVPGGIAYEPERGDKVTVKLPADYAVIDVPGLETIRQLLHVA